MILERAVNSMDDLAREMNVLPNHFAFRGQANADWGLTSTLERVLFAAALPIKISHLQWLRAHPHFKAILAFGNAALRCTDEIN